MPRVSSASPQPLAKVGALPSALFLYRQHQQQLEHPGHHEHQEQEQVEQTHQAPLTLTPWLKCGMRCTCRPLHTEVRLAAQIT